MRRADLDGGGEEDSDFGRLPDPNQAAALKSRGEVPQEDQKEDQKQGKIGLFFFNLGPTIFINLSQVQLSYLHLCLML